MSIIEASIYPKCKTCKHFWDGSEGMVDRQLCLEHNFYCTPEFGCISHEEKEPEDISLWKKIVSSLKQ